ncbi:MAG: YeeE/YedE family protein [Sandaracinaceae bacterium]|nr:YeeE/YedE family protein [Sandaracinaceae bacterium]
MSFLESPFAPLVGGALIGLSSLLLFNVHGKIAGISGIVGRLFEQATSDKAWRLVFLVGLLVPGVIFASIGSEAFALTPVPLSLATVAGVLVGFGTTIANGCTSGHGVCGIARLRKRSIVATLVFMTTGVISTFITHQLIGGF